MGKSRFNPDFTVREWKMIRAALNLARDRISCKYDDEATDKMIDKAQEEAESYYQLALKIPYKSNIL